MSYQAFIKGKNNHKTSYQSEITDVYNDGKSNVLCLTQRWISTKFMKNFLQ